MNKLPPEQSTVKISGKEYQVTYPVGQEKKLVEASNLLNRRIEDAKNTSASIGNEQTIAITALNLAHELIEQRFSEQQRQQSENDAIKSRLRKMNERLSAGTRHFHTENQRSNQVLKQLWDVRK